MRLNDTRWLPRLALVGLVLLVALTGAWQLSAATTYYIDYASGSDSNNGLTKNTAWKKHPWMRNFGGSYTHVAGNDFVFKGGVTWPAQDCLTLVIQGNGTSGDRTVLGVDKSWYTGAAWTKPKFDAQNAEFNLLPDGRGYCVGIQFNPLAPKEYIDIDNIEFANWYWNDTIRDQGWVCHILVSSSRFVRISNCDFKGWTHAPYRGKQFEDQLINILGSNQSPYTEGCEITDCLFDGVNAANQGINTASCQATVFAWGGKILRNTIRNSAGGLFPSGAVTGVLTEIGGNTIGPLFKSYDPTMHHDGIQDNGGKGLLIHDNYLFDVYSVPIFIGAGWGGGTYYVWNNVFDTRNQDSQTPITFDAQSGGNTFFIYNNTIIAGPNLSFFRANWRPTGGNTIAKIDLRNNHFIGEGSTLVVDPGVTIGQFIDQNNIKQTYAVATTSGGYTRANQWRPQTGGVTIGAGQDLSAFRSGALLTDRLGLSRPQPAGGTWDVGAYEFAAAPGPQVPNTPTNVSPASGATGVSLTPTLTGSAFSDPAGLSQTDSQFVVSFAGVTVWDSGSAGVVNSKAVPSGMLNYGTAYTWKWRSRNAVGWSAYSTDTGFTTLAASPPSTPSNSSPSAGAVNQSLTPTLQLSAYSDPNTPASAQQSAQFRILDSTGNTLVHDSGGGLGAVSSYAVPAGQLAYGTTYKYQGRYQSELGLWSAFSTATSFSTTNAPVIPQPPATPSNSSPAGGATGVSLTPTLAASTYSDPGASPHDASQWKITLSDGTTQVWDSGQGAAVTSKSVPAGTLYHATAYKWQVRYRNALGLWSEWSTLTAFTTLDPPAQPPATPSNSSPANAATGVSLTPTLTLSAYSDPNPSAQNGAQFRVWNSAGTTLLHDSGALGAVTIYAVPTNVLYYATTYRWEGRHRNTLGLWSAYSTSSTFTTDAPPQDPVPEPPPPTTVQTNVRVINISGPATLIILERR